MTNTLESIYREHHQQRRGSGFAILKDARGNFIKSAIGTGKHVLDIGCRDGALTSLFVDDNVVTGVDIDKVALDMAERTYGIKTIQLNLNDTWPFVEKSFDAAVAAEVLEHVYYPDQIVQKIAYVLKPSGVFAGSVPNAYSLINRLRYLKGQKRHTPLSDPTHINHFSYTELRDMLSKHFKEVKIVPLGRFAFLDKFIPGFFAFDFMFQASHVRHIAS
ncbi:MAG: hypothetical protein COV34_01050 [Candidatus Zambryskibacteria bacterium CG10_big_fil_rev_8_21_14_0_10_42_12]|uniref:Uncharacterized protein n=1 Tax=Candidatus Zambryskibacteria bacterium CG10_big_fil_rev_8_21_14_0_10_42_12 TaxID=1975115 RepID=A0A2H0QV75_9BACT|nr:MAG: hypothetical protein COV34_01050 [Candidatus Zambryskibacteria bacterium CG10_big_fil_rev_8_21_14_0_10_42_12]